MKFFLSAITILLLNFGTSNAQHTNIGIKGGLNVYNIVNENKAKLDAKPSFHLGLLAHIHLADQFAIQPELVFSVQGATYEPAGIKTNLNLNYLNIPIMFQYMFDNGFRLQAGPQAGFLLSAKAKVGNTETDVKNGYENLDLGMGIGVGYINPSTDFGIDFRYNHGLTQINSAGPVDSFNRGFQLGVFYLFNHE
jgi:hypothetical protein